MRCGKRTKIQFRVACGQLQLCGCRDYWWSIYINWRALDLGRTWGGIKLVAVVSTLGNLRVKRAGGSMQIQEYHQGKWLMLRQFWYKDFVKVYHKFKLKDDESITFYLEEK